MEDLLGEIRPLAAAETCQGNSLQEVSLSQEENEKNRQSHQKRPCKNVRYAAAPGVKGLEASQADGESQVLFLQQIYQRVQEVVPGPDEREDNDRSYDWAGHWHEYLPPDAEAAGPVHARRFVVLVRDGAEELA